MKDSLFDFPQASIQKPIRLIEAFGGIGTQSMALRDIGAEARKVEKWTYRCPPYFTLEYLGIETEKGDKNGKRTD